MVNIYPFLVIINIALENGHRNSGFTQPSIAKCKFTKRYPPCLDSHYGMDDHQPKKTSFDRGTHSFFFRLRAFIHRCPGKSVVQILKVVPLPTKQKMCFSPHVCCLLGHSTQKRICVAIVGNCMEFNTKKGFEGE